MQGGQITHSARLAEVETHWGLEAKDATTLVAHVRDEPDLELVEAASLEVRRLNRRVLDDTEHGEAIREHVVIWVGRYVHGAKR
jgi:hypothetical protein